MLEQPTPSRVARQHILLVYAWIACMVGGSILLLLVPGATLIYVGLCIAATAAVQVVGFGAGQPRWKQLAAFVGVPLFLVVGGWSLAHGTVICPRWLALLCLVITSAFALLFLRRPYLLTSRGSAA
jgi:hypothetical protein